jgi:hypothetical protein
MFGRIVTAGLVLLGASLAGGCCCHRPLFCRPCCSPCCDGPGPMFGPGPGCGCESCYPVGPPGAPLGPPVPPLPPGVPVTPVAPPAPAADPSTGYAPMPRQLSSTATPTARLISPVR